MRHWKNKFLTAAFAAVMAVSMTGCEMPDTEPLPTHIDVDTSNLGPSLSEYVNEGLADAGDNGLYNNTDYSGIRNDDQTPSQPGDTSGNTGNTSGNTSSTDSTNNAGGTGNADNTQDMAPGARPAEEDRELLMETLLGLEYDGIPFAYVYDNEPWFTEEDKEQTQALEYYSELDDLGRVQYAFASLDESLMPEDGEERGDISSIKPTGWVQAKYEGLGNGGWLYNRSHLIAWALAGENDNEKNLMTGTRYFNAQGMLPFEMDVLEYVDENPENHVLYRVTPVFDGDDLLADGVLLEAYSIEDEGELSFCVYIFNVQPDITIDYATGASEKK